MSALPNPTKEARCKFPIEEVKAAVRKLPTYATTVKIVSESNVMNTFKFDCQGTGFLSLGMYLDFSLHEVSDTHTVVQLECRRKIGVIDRPQEYSECIDYMVSTFNMLGKVLDGTAEKK